jgi:Domain of unknown function (DUF4956)
MLLDVLARLAVDAVAVALLAFGLYRPRHGRTDLAVLLSLFNLGVFLAVAVIVQGEFGLSAGLGLFAVLSVMRMRSETFSATELAYLFTRSLLRSSAPSTWAVSSSGRFWPEWRWPRSPCSITRGCCVPRGRWR